MGRPIGALNGTVGDDLARTGNGLATSRGLVYQGAVLPLDVVGSRPPTAEDVVRLPYMRNVIEETMRLYPGAWIFVRSSRRTRWRRGDSGRFADPDQPVRHPSAAGRASASATSSP